MADELILETTSTVVLELEATSAVVVELEVGTPGPPGKDGADGADGADGTGGGVTGFSIGETAPVTAGEYFWVQTDGAGNFIDLIVGTN